ncbi:MAG: hypothetical protein QF535_07660, partial [Anaerolineales bacterium]|nr:hypothetical protein [Anaerolineales bacterium]
DDAISIDIGGDATGEFTFDATGLGIGTTSPGALLTIHSAASNPVEWLTSGTISHSFTNVGFVPEVTSVVAGSIAQRLSTVGGLQINSFTDSATSGQIGFELNSHMGSATPADDAPAIVLAGWKSNGGTGRAAMADGDRILQIRTGTTDLVTVQANGNVGIGTTGPDGTLHVYTNSAGAVTANSVADDLTVENNSHGGISILTPSGDTGNIYFGDEDSNGKGQIRYDHSVDDLSFWTAATEVMTLKDGGNVGIGDTGPDYALEVLNTTSPQFAITHTDTVDFMTIGVDATGDVTFAGSSGKISFSDEDLYTTGDIALDSDTSKLYLGADWDGEIYADATGDVYFANTTSNQDIWFQVNDGGSTETPLFIDGSTSYVGIGTTAPREKLEVEGDFRVSAAGTSSYYAK